MNHDELKGRRVEIILSDPWDLVTKVGDPKLYGQIIETGADSLQKFAVLAHIENPPQYEGKLLEYLVVSSRVYMDFADGIKSGEFLSVNILTLTKRQASSSTPLARWDSDGISATGSIQLVE